LQRGPEEECQRESYLEMRLAKRILHGDEVSKEDPTWREGWQRGFYLERRLENRILPAEVAGKENLIWRGD